MSMGKPIGNGLIELVDEKSHDRGFFCMELTAFIRKESKESGRTIADLWDERFGEARSGVCRYRNTCHIYARTMGKMEKRPVQLQLEFL